jgi:hypothetical protein
MSGLSRFLYPFEMAYQIIAFSAASGFIVIG